MRLHNVLLGATVAVVAQSEDKFSTWTPAGPDDARAPCPMLNSLANHGFLPHHGRNITRQQTIDALRESLNIQDSMTTRLFDFAKRTNPDPTADFFSLDQLSTHNILEHDASLSRGDAYLSTAPQHILNMTVWNETKSYWKYPIIDVAMGVQARLGRIRSARATNPTYSMSNLGDNFSIGEVGAFIILLGDRVTGTVNKSYIEYLFENERLPVALGWTKSTHQFAQPDLVEIMTRITAVEKLALPCPAAAGAGKIKLRAGPHGGDFS